MKLSVLREALFLFRYLGAKRDVTEVERALGDTPLQVVTEVTGTLP